MVYYVCERVFFPNKTCLSDEILDNFIREDDKKSKKDGGKIFL